MPFRSRMLGVGPVLAALALAIALPAPASAQEAPICLKGKVKLDDGRNNWVGTNGRESVTGLRGKDHLIGRGGNDLLNGGPGEDACDGGDLIDRGIGCRTKVSVER
jgi:hypothetical protein